jgi:Arc/MetJ family transcription regulator
MSDSVIKLTSEFDPAIIGLSFEDQCVIYSAERIIEVLVTTQKLTVDDALEHFCHNMGGSKGEGLPRYVWTDELDDLMDKKAQ